jgi:hypothetical protein
MRRANVVLLTVFALFTHAAQPQHTLPLRLVKTLRTQKPEAM